MNLTDQIVSGIDEINLQNSLNAALLELKVTMGANTVAPSGNEMIIYVDKESSSNPTSERKQYVFNLENPLKYYNQVGDELVQTVKIKNNDIIMAAVVNRAIGNDGTSDYILDDIIVETLENVPITLFEGTNYIYTNYQNANIDLIYPKDNLENKVLLNNAIYCDNKLNSTNEFTLDDIYFKDAFTKNEDDLNLEVNNISIDSISSNNDNFSLDSNGNLTVNSITSNDSSGLMDNETICNLIYPIGSIYLSVNSANPATLFGGNWTQLKDRFLLGSGDTYNNGATGGSATHTHTSSAHSHSYGSLYAAINFAGTNGTRYRTKTGVSYTPNERKADSGAGYTYSTALNEGVQIYGDTASTTPGGTGSTSTLPPYLVVYMWKRIA